MRVTRAAMRAEQAQHTHVDDPNAPDSLPDHDRVPLADVSANTAPALDAFDAPATKTAASKTTAKKKAAKGTKAKAAHDDDQVLPDEPAADTHQSPPLSDDVRPVTPPPHPVRMTRRQLAKCEEEASVPLPSHPPSEPEPAEQDAATQGPNSDPADHSQERTAVQPSHEIIQHEPQAQEETLAIAQERHAQDIMQPSVQESAPLGAHSPEQIPTTPSPEVPLPEPKVLTSEIPFEGTSTPVKNGTISRTISRSSTRSTSRTPMRLEESISAIDDLEDALENVGTSLPSFDQLVDDKSPKKPRPARNTTSGKPPSQLALGSSMSRTVSRNPSLAPRSIKSTGLSRTSSVRAPPRPRQTSADTTDYLASKRRPVSMTFAPPPPPAKSNKPPTTSDFELPGERIAAELKAKKEERLKRLAEAGPAKPRPISMPPTARSTKPPTKSDFQLPGERVAAELKAKKEERLKRMAQGETTAPRLANLPPPPKSTKPPTVPKFQLPGEKLAAEQKARKEERLKREAEEAETAKQSASRARPAPTRKPVAVPRQTLASQARERLMRKENSSGLTSEPLQQPTVFAKPGPTDPVVHKNKGREVFNRDRLEKEARDNERREKEEAAKRARAEAAERGRIASREWAKKQLEKKQEEAERARKIAT